MEEVLSLAWSDRPDASTWPGCGTGVALWKVSEGPPLRTDTILELNRSRCLATVLNYDRGLLVWAEENRLQAWDVAEGQETPCILPT